MAVGGAVGTSYRKTRETRERIVAALRRAAAADASFEGIGTSELAELLGVHRRSITQPLRDLAVIGALESVVDDSGGANRYLWRLCGTLAS